MLVRKARLQDATNIYELVNSLSHDGTLLRRVFAEICENVRDFTVAESEAGVFLGCGALHLYGPHLAEVRSIVVRRKRRARAWAANCFLPCWTRPKTTALAACACLRAFPISSFAMAFAKWKTGRRCRTRSLRTARTARAFIAATKSPWRADRCRRFRILGPRIEAEQLGAADGVICADCLITRRTILRYNWRLQ